ncbi:MFS transporter [Oceaniglobus trochenteri]|uniref:MFS transporter n=1 Tax=Oceaniglobus trochenteri TaxID=2763260 RepID=UPI001CFFC81D|nr:MFS transporter [Oceaniglobus trochenteri]
MQSPLSRTNWPLVWLLFIAGLLAAGQFAKVSLALPSWALAYDRPLGEVAILVSALGTVGIVLGVVAGMIVARVGQRRMLLGALVFGGAVSLAQATLPGFELLFISRVAEGFSHLVIVIAAPTMMAGIARPADQPVVMGLWGTFFGVSFAMAAIVVPLIVDQGGLPALMLWHGGALWLIALAIWRWAPQPVGHPPRLVTSVLGEHIAIYRTPRLLAPALGFVWHTLTFVALLTFLPLVPGTPSPAILPILSLAGTMLAGFLARSIAPGRIALAGFILIALVSILLLVTAPPVQGILTCALFAVIGLIPGASFAAIPALNAETANRARANGAVAQLGNVGTTLGTPLFATVFWAGFDGLMILTGILALCGALSVVIIHRKIGREI